MLLGFEMELALIVGETMIDYKPYVHLGRSVVDRVQPSMGCEDVSASVEA
jgi:hypothetical protein